IQTGAIDEYRHQRTEFLRRFASANDSVLAERGVKDCLIIPADESELAGISKLADTAVAAGPEHSYWIHCQFSKGFAEYRQARFSSAVEWEQKVVGKPGDMYRNVQAHMVLAM